MVDILVASAWRVEGRRSGMKQSGARVVSEQTNADQFVWRQGRSEVIVEREGDSWRVSYTVVGRLFGPRQVLYEQRHKLPKHAAWDVMTRVIRASQNEDEGVRIARDAARWMIEHRGI